MDERGTEHVEELALEPVALVRKGRPRALWAVLAVVGVAAGALVVTSADDDGNQVPGLPVDLALGSAAGGEAAAADASMPAWVTYVAGEGLPALGGEGTAYRIPGGVDEEQVEALAAALDLESDVQSDGAGTWWVANEGGCGRLDVYATGGAASWSFFSGCRDCVTDEDGIGACCDPGKACTTFATTGAAIGGCEGASGDGDVAVDCAAVPTTSTTACLEAASPAPDECLPRPDQAGCDALAGDCAEPVPGSAPGSTSGDPPVGCDDSPEGAAACEDPSATLPALEGEELAKEAALAVVAASGADTDGALVDARAGGESRSWSITVEPRLDGLPTGLFAYVEVSESGVVLSGNGYLARAEVLGEYPLLGTRQVIDRANAQSGVATDLPLGAPEAMSSTPASTGGPTDVGGTTGGDTSVTTIAPGTDPCAVPEGASDGCGGTTGCGGDGCTAVEPTTVPCKVQADGVEICEHDCAELAPVDGTVPAICLPPCPQAAPPADEPVDAPATIECTPPVPDPGGVPVPDPGPIEIILVDAERSLVLLPANDASGDSYLVPAYRFADADGGQVDLPAVADEALAGPDTTDTTVPDTVAPAPAPVPEPTPDPQPCEVLEEGDSSATTHTVQTCPDPSEDPGVLGEGEEPVVGVGYYVDIDTQCAGGSFALGRQIWWTEDPAVAGWADPGERHEGGTFTLDREDHGTFVGDEAGTLVAEFRTLGPAEDIFCTPEPRP